MTELPCNSLSGSSRWIGFAVCLSMLIAGCLDVGPNAETSSESPIEALQPGVTRVQSDGEVSISRDGSTTAVRIATDPFSLAGELRQHAIRASEDVSITLRNSAVYDGWGGRGGCALVSAQYPAPFAKTLVFGEPSPSYYDDHIPKFGQFHSAWGGGGYVTTRVMVDGNEVVDDGIQVPRPPLFAEPTTYGHRGDSHWDGTMEAGSWLLLIAGGLSSSTLEKFEWTASLDATGDLEVYRLPPAPVQCGLWANGSHGSTEASATIYSFARDVSMAMQTKTASTLYVEHQSREITKDPTSTAIHKGSYDFLGAKGQIVKDSVAGKREFVHCFASIPGDVAIHFDEVTGSSTVLWMLADTAFLPFSRTPACEGL